MNLLGALNGAIFNRQAEEAAELYARLLKEMPTYSLRPPVQYDLAWLLDTAGKADLALKAYSVIIQTQLDNPTRAPSMREAGRLAIQLGEEERGIELLLNYLDTNPLRPDREAAEEVLKTVKQERVEAVRNRRNPPVFTPELPEPKRDSEIKIELPPPPPKEETPETPPAPRMKPRREPGLNMVYRPERVTSDSIRLSSVIPKITGEEAAAAPHQQQQAPPPPQYPPTPYYPGAPYPPPGYYPPPPPGYAYPLPPYPVPYPTPMAPATTPMPTAAPAAPVTQRKVNQAEDTKTESEDALYERLRDAQFALVLPVGKKIRLDAVAQLIAKREKVDEFYARKQVLRRKGVVFDHLDMDDLQELLPLIEESQQSLWTVVVPRDLKPTEFHTVVGAEVRDQGLKLFVDSGDTKRVRWDDIKLLNCGRISGRVAVTLVGCNPVREFRIDDRHFDYGAFSPAGIATLEEGYLELIQLIATHSPQAVHCQVVKNLLAGRANEPQVFDAEDEFVSYTHWALFTNYCEIVDLPKLVELHRRSSDW